MASAHNRVNRLLGHIDGGEVENKVEQCPTASTTHSSFTVTDNRNGKKFDVAIKNGVVSATDIFKNSGLRPYDPGCKNTATATSRITWIDGPKGILRYRGYPIEQLAEKSTFLEVAYLLMYGELPNQGQFTYFRDRVMKHTYIHNNLKGMMKSFRYDSHPMGMVITTVAAMSTFHPEANPALAGQDVYDNKVLRNKQIHRIIGTMPTIAAYAYRHRIGRPYVDPVAGLSYAENFLYMLDKLSDTGYRPHPKLVRALDILFILHADHELNCSTTTMRTVASSGVDVYSAIAAAGTALYGPRHGGANEAVLRMLTRIGSVDNIPAFIEGVKARKEKLMGFGHRVYRNYDPRAKLVRSVAKDVFAILGKEPLIEIATELERIALSDEYFVKRKLYPNVDFYSGLIYKAMGFPTDFFPVLFMIPRTVGWLSHWSEFLDDPENKIVRPRQVYLGSESRDYVPIVARPRVSDKDISSYQSSQSKRYGAGTL